jgi:hypothetical protein
MMQSSSSPVLFSKRVRRDVRKGSSLSVWTRTMNVRSSSDRNEPQRHGKKGQLLPCSLLRPSGIEVTSGTNMCPIAGCYKDTILFA